jgi:hypothetical protein
MSSIHDWYRLKKSRRLGISNLLVSFFRPEFLALMPGNHRQVGYEVIV